MRYPKRKCDLCKSHDMVVQKGRRGFYYQCPGCRFTVNKTPSKIPVNFTALKKDSLVVC
jgi:ssDNA-binding Zn-finger/Zn-ribbon topoisomerase 1